LLQRRPEQFDDATTLGRTWVRVGTVLGSFLAAGRPRLVLLR
jgi:hypothetical protein